MTATLEDDFLGIITDIFEFIGEYILPNILGDADSMALKFVMKQSQHFNAGIQIVESNRATVHINNGAVQRLYNLCAENIELIETSNGSCPIVNSTETPYVGLAYSSALIFLLLHESAHWLSGHVEYIAQRYPEMMHRELGYCEVHIRPASSNFCTFRKMSELEADGTAFALLLEFRDEIYQSLGLEEVFRADQNRAEISVLLGCFIALCTLENLFEIVDTRHDEYPTAATRLINLCSSYLRVVDPEIVQWKGDDHRFVAADHHRATSIAQTYQNTIAPAFIMLHQILTSNGIKSDFFREENGVVSDKPTEFMRDILQVLGGSTPHFSPYGVALSELSNNRVKFMQALQDFRLVDLWPMGEKR